MVATSPAASLRLLVLSLAASAALHAQTTTEVEPNNTVATAQLIQFGQQVQANLGAGDEDWFFFTLAATAEVHAQTSGNYAVNPSVDTCVVIYDATGTQVLAFNDNQRGNHSDCGVTLVPGLYNVKVFGKLGTTTGDYGLDLLQLPAATNVTTEGAEPNGNPATAGVPTPFVPGSVLRGDIATATDEDWFTFAVTSPSLFQCFLQDDGLAPQMDRSRLSLWVEGPPGTWTTLGASTVGTTSHRVLNYQHAQLLQPGNYALAVLSGGSGTTAPFTYSGIGNYGVRTLLIDIPGTTVVTEAPEPNNTLNTAALITPGALATGTIIAATPPEGDWYLFSVSAPTTVVAMTANGATAPITDTTVRILNQAGTALATGSTGGASSHGRVIYTCPVAGIYFVEVAGGTISAGGDYVLYFGAGPALALGATFRQEPPSTNACPGSNSLRPALLNASGEVPQVGTTFVLRLQNALPNALAIPFYGLSNTIANGGTVPLPFDLTASGAPGCFLRVDPQITTLGVADGGGVLLNTLIIPASVGLRGLTLYAQAMLLDPANNQLGISMSNDVRLVLGDRGY